VSQFRLCQMLHATLTAGKQQPCPATAPQETSESRKTTTSHSSVGNISCLPDLTKIAEKSTHCPGLYSPSVYLAQRMFLKASKDGGSVPSSVTLCQGCLFRSVKTATASSLCFLLLVRASLLQPQ